MSRLSRHLPLLLLAWLPVCAGCRLMDADAPLVSEAASDEMLDALRGQLNRDLWQPNPQWSLLDIDPHPPAGGEDVAVRRWVFRSQSLDAAISQLDAADRSGAPAKREEPAGTVDDTSVTESNSGSDSEPESPSDDIFDDAGDDAADKGVDRQADSRQHWNGFWPLGVGQVLDALDAAHPSARNVGLGERYLKQLAADDSLSGWNAAILLAQRDPAAARHLLPVLEKLVSSYSESARVEVATDPDGNDAQASSANDDSVEDLVQRVAQQLRAETGLADRSEKPEESPPSKLKSLQARLLDALGEEPGAPAPDETPADDAPDPRDISDSMRCAAAEAWCLVLAAGHGDPLDEMASAGRLLERADLPNRLRAELYRGVARCVPPRLIPRLTNALRVSDGGGRVPLAVRQAAIDSCLIHALRRRRQRQTMTASAADKLLDYDPSLWPETVVNGQSDDDPAIRRAFGRWAAVANYRGPVADAASLLENQLHDRETSVRHDAIVSLGWLGTEPARQLLRKQAERPEAVIRATAVKALSRWGVEELAPRTADESALVRQVVAEQLSHFPAVRSYFLLLELLRDDNLQVQQAAVGSLKNWPDDPALSLLLIALRDGSGPTRRLAFQQLRERRTIDGAFSMYDSPRHEDRSDAVDQLAARLNVSLKTFNRMEKQPLRRRRGPDPLHVRNIESLLQTATDANLSPSSDKRADARSRLLQLDAEDVPIIEPFLLQSHGRDVDFIYRQALPRLSPAHAALNRLMDESSDLQQKRQAARRLREFASGRSLSRLMVQRLVSQLDGGTDLLIWRDAMTAIMPDATDDHAQAALRALGDERAEVCLLGCQYVLRHPRPRFANWLQFHGLFRHDNDQVRLAAIKAAGLCNNPSVLDDRPRRGAEPRPGSPAALPGLRSLLTDADPATRIAAVIAAAHLGDAIGMEELTRLCRHAEPQIRLRAVEAMRDTESTWFIGPLIQAGWTEQHVDVRRAILHSLNQLTLPGKRPENLVDEKGYDAKITRWNQWWQEQRETSDDSPEPDAGGGEGPL